MYNDTKTRITWISDDNYTSYKWQIDGYFNSDIIGKILVALKKAGLGFK